MSALTEEEDQTLSNRSLEANPSTEQQLKLPKLPVIPPSRGRLMSRKQNKAPVNLPSIKNDSDQEFTNNFRNTEIIHQYRGQRDINKDDDFSIQVQEKLKMILGNEPNKESIENPSGQYEGETVDFEEDDIDFQAKINQNKEIIKMHKQKKEQKIQSNKVIVEMPPKKVNKAKSRTSKPGKVESAYEKKMKDYNNSLENRFLQRKKQSLGIIPEKSKEHGPKQQQIQRNKSKKIMSMKDSLEKEKSSFGYQNFESNPNQYQKNSNSRNVMSNKKKSLPTPLTLAGPKSQKRLEKNQIVKTEATSPSRKDRDTKDATLFDNIHNFLENPKAVEKQEQILKEMFSKMKKRDKSISKLEDKIRLIDEKMGIGEASDTKSTHSDYNGEKPFMITESPLDRTVRDWKRIEIKDKVNLNYHESNFDKEIDYVNQLQEKNSNSLSNFLEHQKMMVGFSLQKKHKDTVQQLKEKQSES